MNLTQFAEWLIEAYHNDEGMPEAKEICREARAALATQPAQPSAQGEAVAQWMPIETAPIDGSKVLLNWKSGVVVGWYEKRTSNTHLSPWRRDLFGLRDTCYGAEPTHWMPLPTPPGHASAPAAPAQAVPLTDEQIERLKAKPECWEHVGQRIEFRYLPFARAIERAHGIKAAP